jgi:hypothetical protein
VRLIRQPVSSAGGPYPTVSDTRVGLPTSDVEVRPLATLARQRSFSSAWAAAALTLLVVAAYLRFLGAGFAGTDSLPLIETSRVLSWSDFLQQLRQPVMAGTAFTSGELIYRPVVSLTFALDYLVWGLNPAGYHVTNIVFHVVTTLAVFGLLRGLGLARWSSFLGASLVALHPSVVAAVPVIARRDNLASAAPFCLALVCITQAVRGRELVWTALGLLLFALALLSKEMAFGALPLVPLVAFGAGRAANSSVPNRRDWRPYVWRISVLFGATAVLMFVLRFAVLGSLGGYSGTSIGRPDGQLYRHILVTFARFLFWPFRDIVPAGSLGWLVAPAALVIVLLVASALMPRRTGVPLAIGTLWLVGFALFYTLLKTFTGAWYLYFALPGAALILAALLEWSVTALHSRRDWRALAAMAGTAVFLIATVWSSALVQSYDAWLIDGAASARYLSAVVECARAAPDGAVLTFAYVPDYLDYPDNTQTELLTPTLVYEHTLTSALRLALPDRALSVAVEGYAHLRSVDHLTVSCDPAPNGRHIVMSS